MLRKRLLAMGLIVTIGLGGLTGCGDKNTTQQETTKEVESTTESVSETEETSEEETPSEQDTEESTSGVMGEVNAEDICKNISINGELVEFPWTLNELGDEYEFSSVSDFDITDGKCTSTLLYNGNRMFNVSILEDDEIDRNSLIYGIYFNINDDVKVYEFGRNTTKNEVIDRLGEPDKITDGGLMYAYYYTGEDISIVVFFTASNDTIANIDLDILEK